MGSNRKIVALLQARMGSTRLPGKVLADLCGQPMLSVLLGRLRPAQSVDEWVMATTRLPEDDVLCKLAGEQGMRCFRGSTEDCLDRYFQAARLYDAEIVVRLTADNPLVHAELVDWVLKQYLASGDQCDYMVSSSTGGFPFGLSVEVFPMKTLEIAWNEARDIPLREHVTLYVLRRPERFVIRHLDCEEDFSDVRWTVDTPDDLTFVQRIFESFGHDRFTWREAVAMVRQHPEWLEINRHRSVQTALTE